MKFKINKKIISEKSSTYFIADIAANHDGNIKKAFELIYEAKKAGADAAKFQHFSAETIVSDKTFSSMRSKLSHQSQWKKSVFQVYKEASLNLDWTSSLYKHCKKIGIDFFTSPYSVELVDHVDNYVPAYKIGSGDITWLEIIKHISKKKKPVILATGASNLNDVSRAIREIKKYNNKICVMQCNTNYTASKNNFNFINLNVLKTYKKNFKNVILGLSDHTHGHATVLGAIALGAKIIEKHFTLSNDDKGPDHKFSMTPKTWREMVEASRELELSMGTDIKKIEKNELNTCVVQRRSMHFKKDYRANEKLKIKDLIPLRPCLEGSVQPYEIHKIKNKKIKKKKLRGEILLWKDLK
jgi:sialic acid synthase SpsE